MSQYLDQINDGIIIIDGGRKVRYANPAAASLMGMDSIEAGTDCSKIFGLEAGSCIWDLTQKTGAQGLIRHELPASEGLRRVVELTLSRAADEYIATIRDVTESVKLEEILERYAEGLTVLYELSSFFLSEASMSSAMDSALQMIREYYSADYVLVSVPSSQSEMEIVAGSGWTDREVAGLRLPLDGRTLIGRSMIERCPALVVDFRKETELRRSELLEQSGVMSGISVPMVVEDRALGVMEVLYRSAREIDTAELWYMNVVTNTLAVYIEKQRSLGRLQDSEKFLSSVLEGIGEGVIVIDRNYNIISANKGFLQSHRLRAEDVIGRNCHMVSHRLEEPCHASGGLCAVRQVFETGQHASSVHKHINSEGGLLDVETNAYPLYDSTGKVAAVVETVMDVTARTRLERDVEKRVKELEEFYDMAVGRELRMIELKEEIKTLRAELDSLRQKAK